MTATQSNKLAMYHAVRVFLTGFLNSTTATSLFPALAAKQASLITLITNITGHAATQDEPLAAVIDTREQALEQATTATLEIAGSLLSYARTHAQPDLIAQAQITGTTFARMRRAERMRLAQRIHDLAEPLATALADYGVTAARLTELQTLIEAANTAVDGRTSTGAAKKVATAELDRLCGQADDLLDQIDPMLVQLGRVDPETYAAYGAARTVFNRPGSRNSASAATTPPTTAAAVTNPTSSAAPEASAERKAA